LTEYLRPVGDNPWPAMSETLITVVAVVAIVFVWERWEQRRGIDEELAERQGEYGWRLMQFLGGAFLLLVVGLVLDAVGVPGAGVAALIGLAGLVLLVYVAPFLGPRRRRR
jgi:peptidoglycan/LPS O-acetylase OafA/YrhL